MTDDSRQDAAGRLALGEGLTVGRLGFGAMRLPGPGSWGPPQDRGAALAVLRRAAERGVEHIDTSDFYGPRVANELIREALHPYPERLVIATKVGVRRDGPRAWNAAATPDALAAQVEGNLERLGLDRLDLVYLRAANDGMFPPDADATFEESFTALAGQRERGLIRNLGLSGVTVEQLEQARALAPVTAVQNRFHLLDRDSADVLRYCEEHGIAFVPYFPLAAGALRADLDPALIPPGWGLGPGQAATLDAIAARHGATRAQVALAWLLAHAPHILLIPGTGSLAHLEENLAAGSLALGDDEVAELDKLTG
ncbi:aldo/keto reductase [Streptomyces avicenniae]|uniref:aldo/keto reductase n=1 Tax=Streptomyces avicenniae TaxID=500153 RepID=UPI00069A0C31|nr:aldo/keto reductase [Streptomyces avicenniae]